MHIICSFVFKIQVPKPRMLMEITPTGLSGQNAVRPAAGERRRERGLVPIPPGREMGGHVRVNQRNQSNVTKIRVTVRVTTSKCCNTILN